MSAIQFKAIKGNTRESLGRLYSLIGAAGDRGADLVVCPEMAHTGYLFRDATEIRALAEPAEAGCFPELSHFARVHEMYIVSGYVEAGEDNQLFNSARVIDPSGKLLVSYRKRLLYTSDETWASPGRNQYHGAGIPEPYPMLKTEFGRMAVGICMDLNDNRFTAFLRKTQPEVIAFPTNWIDEGFDVHDYWRWRLLGVSGVLVAANTYGMEECAPHPRTRFHGRSVILPLQRAHASEIGPVEGDSVLVWDCEEY